MPIKAKEISKVEILHIVKMNTHTQPSLTKAGLQTDVTQNISNTPPIPCKQILPKHDWFLFVLLGLISLSCFIIGTHTGIADIKNIVSLAPNSSHLTSMYVLGGFMWFFQYMVLDPMPFQKNRMIFYWKIQNMLILSSVLVFIFFLIS